MVKIKYNFYNIERNIIWAYVFENDALSGEQMPNNRYPHMFPTQYGRVDLSGTGEEFIISSNPIETVVNGVVISINPKNQLTTTTHRTLSDGRSYAEATRYIENFTLDTNKSGDDHFTACCKMLKDYNISNQIESIKQLGNNVVEGELIKYKIYNGIIVPAEIYQLELMSPKNSFRAAEFRNGNQFEFDPSYKLRVTFDLFDFYGNIQQYHDYTGKYVVFLWGFNGKLPIAKIEYATLAEVRSALRVFDFNFVKGLAP